MTALSSDVTRLDLVERFRQRDGDYSDESEDDAEWETWFDATQQERFFDSLIRRWGHLSA